MSQNAGNAAPKVPPESFYCVFEFMSAPEGLALKGVELTVYALVYSYSQGRGGCYYGSNAMTAHRAGCSERHAISVIHALEARGLIRNVGEHKWRGGATNMYEAAPEPAARAIERCRRGAPPEAASPGAQAKGEETPPLPLNWVQQPPEEKAPDKKAIAKDMTGDAGMESAFAEIERSYPFMRDEAAARRLYAPLYEKGVMPRHIAAMLREWEKDHPGKDGRRPFFPDLARFLDPNNPEGYCALAEKANRLQLKKRAARIRRLTADCFADEMYERYAKDGCDAKATELYQALSESKERRGESWDRWYQYMLLKRDVEAREHWIEVSGAGRS